jgi:hypothetical protein
MPQCLAPRQGAAAAAPRENFQFHPPARTIAPKYFIKPESQTWNPQPSCREEVTLLELPLLGIAATNQVLFEN